MKKDIKKISLLIIVASIILFGCDNDETTITEEADTEESVTPPSTAPNILLIIADDMGKDATVGFSEGNIKPNTPNINNIKNSGITFNNCWVYPTCSPTRASIITGKYGYRTGVKWAGDELSNSETTIQRYIDQQTNDAYETAIIGKWHLSGNGMVSNPELFGIDYYTGLSGGAVQSYYQWPLTNDEQQTIETSYITEKFTDLSIDWVTAQDKPWFLWLAYTAPHTPFHAPPVEMHSQGNLPDFVDGMDELPYYLAAIEAMDYQIGRLLESIPEDELENTVIIFIGDNGTPNQVAQFPYSNFSAKGSLYQGGVNTPLFVSGKGVNRIGDTDNNLITSTDLYATIAEITGVSITEINDSKSFMPLFSETTTLRDYQYVEKNDGTNDLWAISNGHYKLLINANGNEEMYDIIIDPYENNDLLEETLSIDQLEAKADLESELIQIRN
ncbi:sulfatase-like hydrolase/transferase [Dokdonia sp.]|uniref:sulfatase-like hydrolase/transferase n=1 Tax=Dokdonia sp. TaxID=2024995 RepID=UPI003264853A